MILAASASSAPIPFLDWLAGSQEVTNLHISSKSYAKPPKTWKLLSTMISVTHAGYADISF